MNGSKKKNAEREIKTKHKRHFLGALFAERQDACVDVNVVFIQFLIV